MIISYCGVSGYYHLQWRPDQSQKFHILPVLKLETPSISGVDFFIGTFWDEPQKFQPVEK